MLFSGCGFFAVGIIIRLNIEQYSQGWRAYVVNNSNKSITYVLCVSHNVYYRQSFTRFTAFTCFNVNSELRSLFSMSILQTGYFVNQLSFFVSSFNAPGGNSKSQPATPPGCVSYCGAAGLGLAP